jgi:hypothetical protein
MERIPTARWISASATAGLTVVALALFLRRVTGGPVSDLGAGETALYAGLFAAAAVGALRPLVEWVMSPARSSYGSLGGFLLTLVFVAGLSGNGFAVLVGIAAATVVPALLLAAEYRGAQAAQTPATGDVGTRMASPVRGVAGSDDGPGHGEPSLELRRSTAQDGERVAGRIRFEADAGETTKVLHVPLWPPLAGPPNVCCELEGVEGRVRVPLAKANGFRIEVRLTEVSDEPVSGAVRFTAVCRAASAAA